MSDRLATDLLKAWLAWDRWSAALPDIGSDGKPTGRFTGAQLNRDPADRMEDACQAMARWVGVEATALRSTMASACRTGAVWGMDPRLARRWALAAAAGHS